MQKNRISIFNVFVACSITVALMFFSSCSESPKKAGERLLSEFVQKETGGHLGIQNYQHINGTPITFTGMEGYQIEYTADLVCLKDGGSVNDTKGSLWLSELSIFDENTPTFTKLTVGEVFALKHNPMILTKSDNGWVLSQR